ncbi:ovalbumin isoform X2 [Stomoxys calcitrans]|uniref:ovalbumin isoform X2 n=1 Tax=Stomoxys calcitrans TaxID=35570 RepID=UPI0027E233FF|nr:ovalbumin isoform X2 [Stomoxys calcitrans]
MKLLELVLCLIPFCAVANANVEVREFTLDYIQHILNNTDEEDNIAVAPYAAFQLYEELFEPNAVGSEEDESEEDPQESPTIIKHQLKQQSFVEQNVTMKARWTFNFQTRDTSKRPFRQLDAGDRTFLVDNLRKDDVFRYTNLEKLFNASILELPLHFNEVKLWIILPQMEDGLAELKDYLVDNIDVIEEISNSSYKTELVRVMMPKFNLNFQQNLRDFYDELSDEDITQYEDIHQIITLKFKEHGIGDFHKINVLFWNAYSDLRIVPKVVDISHPFLFMITNKEGIQFFGQVVKCEP